MKKTQLKNTDLYLSNICYGTANYGEFLSEEQAFRNLDMFVDLGGNFIDTANVYCKWVDGLDNCSEQYLGKWLKERNAYHKVCIATKGAHYDFGNPEKSRVTKADIQKDMEESMQTLGVDHMDFYWLHRDDESIEIEAIIDMMEEFVKEGKIRYYGASNYKQYRMEKAVQYAAQKKIQGFTAVSNQWSMATVNEGGNLNSDPSLVMMDHAYYQWHVKEGMPIVPFSSAAHGFFQKLYRGAELSEGMKRAYMNEKNMEMYRALCKLSEETGMSLYGLSQAWLLNQPFQVFPVGAVSKPEQMEEFVKISELELDQEFVEKFIP